MMTEFQANCCDEFEQRRNKENFINKVADILRITYTDFLNLKLMDDDIVKIEYIDTSMNTYVNIAGDSYMAILKDIIVRIRL